MLYKEKNGICYLQFESLLEFPHLQHAIITRKGGMSSPPFDSLNLGLFTDDTSTNINKNFDKIKNILSIDSLYFMKQIHSDIILNIDKKSPPQLQGDALTTRDSSLGLVTQHADCQTAIIYDPKNNALANIHCGWRGLVLNIYSKTLSLMKKLFNTNARECFVGVGPSLGTQFSEFKNYKEEFPPHFWSFQVKENFFDLWEIANNQLRQAGVLSHHTETARICTFEHSQHFFSYRRDQVTGRNATLAWLTVPASA